MAVKIVSYHAVEKGKVLTVLGAVHGNEVCGVEAIKRVIEEIDLGELTLKRGVLKLIPVANPLAYKQGVRYVDRNLNRSLYPKEHKRDYEDYLDPILCSLLDETDIVLDLHSFASQGEPFIFLEDSHIDEEQYARTLGVEHFVYGWSEAFGIMQDKESQGTVEYARYKGKIAVTLECGHHADPRAVDVGYQAIIQSLFFFDLIDPACASAQRFKVSSAARSIKPSQRCIRMRTVYYHQKGAVLAKPWKHLDRVAKDEPMAFLGGDEAVLAPADGFIILPKAQAKAGEEWFYFGVTSDFPAECKVLKMPVEEHFGVSL
jgi:Succinylglutamate desuccinylase / Aspartoacylase family